MTHSKRIHSQQRFFPLLAALFAAVSCGSLPKNNVPDFNANLSDYFQIRGANAATQIPGPEDIAWDHQFDRLLISVHDRRSDNSNHTGEKVQAGIFYVAPEKRKHPEPLPIANKNDMPGKGKMFKPHGIDIFTSTAPETQFLYAISKGSPDAKCKVHKVKENDSTDKLASILKFQIRQDDLLFLDCFATSYFYKKMPNDLVVYDEDKFFVSNFHSVLHHNPDFAAEDSDPAAWRAFDLGYKWGNGIALIPDGLVVSTSLAGKLYVFLFQEDKPYDLNAADLHEIDSVKLNAGKSNEQSIGLGALDNLNVLPVAEGGSPSTLLVATQWDRLEFFLSKYFSGLCVPSFVFQIDLGSPPAKKDEDWEPAAIVRFFDQDGVWIKGASSAIQHDGKLILGQVYDPWIVVKKVGAGSAN